VYSSERGDAIGTPKTIGLAIGLALIARPQQPDLRIDTTEVATPVSVTDENNRPIHGLGKESFRIFDEGVEQTITSFGSDDRRRRGGAIGGYQR
jgi:hypothetical protein